MKVLNFLIIVAAIGMSLDASAKNTSAMCKFNDEQLIAEIPLWDRDDAQLEVERDGITALISGKTPGVAKFSLIDKSGAQAESEVSRGIPLKNISVTLVVGGKKTVLSCIIE